MSSKLDNAEKVVCSTSISVIVSNKFLNVFQAYLACWVVISKVTSSSFCVSTSLSLELTMVKILFVYSR